MSSTLTRWDPFAELASMRSAMDRIFDHSLSRFPSLRTNGEEIAASDLALDVYETNDEFVVKAAVPGIDPKDVDISVDDDVLTIRGDYERRDQVDEDRYLRRELHWGGFARQLRLPPTVDAEHANASFENGILTLTLPKKPEARARVIKITPHGVIAGPDKAKN